MDDAKRKIDWAATLPGAVAMRDLYRGILDGIPQFSDWLVGFERDPVPVHGIFGYVIYARPKPQEELPPGQGKPPEQRKPPGQPAARRRHPNRS